jgi:hypothetical protein
MTPFDAIYVINLPTRKDRRAQMVEQFRKVGVDPASPQVVFFDAVRPTDAGNFPSIGARGCFMSHLGVARAALQAGHERILILEDDVNFSHDFLQRAGALLAELASRPWNALYLGALAVNPPPAAQAGWQVLPGTSKVTGSHMIALDKQGIAQLAEHLQIMLDRQPGHPEGGPMHVDGAYNWFRRTRPQLTTLLVEPALGYQRPSRTDIHDLKWFDRVPVLSHLVGWLRAARARLATHG